jgi:hypothetical protein
MRRRAQAQRQHANPGDLVDERGGARRSRVREIELNRGRPRTPLVGLARLAAAGGSQNFAVYNPLSPFGLQHTTEKINAVFLYSVLVLVCF